MALTIQDAPQTNFSGNPYPRPAFAPIEYLVSSDQTAQDGFKVIVSVFRDPSGDNAKIATLQLNTIPSATQVITDIQNIVQSFVQSNYSIVDGDTTNVVRTDLSEFKVAFQEYYSGAFQGSAVSGDVFTSFNAAPKYQEFAKNDYYNWSINAGLAGDVRNKFLNGFAQDAEWFNFNSSNNFIRINRTQKYQSSWIIAPTSSITYTLYLKTMDSAFNTIRSTTMSLTNTAGLYTLDVGPSEVASHSWAVTPVMTDVKYYALRILDEVGDFWVTDSIMFEIDDCDSTYTPYELHWLNRKGGWDSYTFNGKSNQETTINKNFAKYNTRKIESNTIVHKTYAQRKRAFHTGLRDTYTLNSRLLRDAEVNGLQDLFSSPEVYWKDGSKFVSVNVTNNTYRHAKSENGQVYSMELTMEVDSSDKRQW